MEYTVSALKEELQVAKGERPADLVLENLKLVDVYTDEIRPSSIAIYNKKIVALDADHIEGERFDCGGEYAVPGFMDAHVHIETTLLTPEELSRVIVPWGTTTLFVDAMEIANVYGVEGLLSLVKDSDRLPFRILLEIPSRVPTAPGLETAGAYLGVQEVRCLLERKESVSLGELDPSKILGIKDEYLEKVCTALNLGKICNGHAIGLDWKQLNVYAAGHLSDDHECVEFEELQERLRLGIKPMIREGSSERNLETLIKGVIEHGLSTENLLFCTDDKHVNDIHLEGHISYNIQKSIDLGLDPVKAIKIATINIAKHFRLEHMIGSLTPGRQADIVFLKDLTQIRPTRVYKDGALVARDQKAVTTTAKEYPTELFSTVHIPKDLSKHSFTVKATGTMAKCRVISMIPDQIINEEKQVWLKVENGEIKADVENDILKIAVVERHGKNGRVSTGFVTGFGLKRGALSSSVSHDHHNIVVVGCDEEDMLQAVLALGRLQGGFAAAAEGKVLDSIALPLAGLMSTEPCDVVMETINRLNDTARSLGCSMKAPFMSLSFVSLPTVPELGLTDVGLIDVLKHQVTDLIVEVK